MICDGLTASVAFILDIVDIFSFWKMSVVMGVNFVYDFFIMFVFTSR